MLKYFLEKKAKNIGLGLDLKPGDKHYQAYIGSPPGRHLVKILKAYVLFSGDTDAPTAMGNATTGPLIK